MKKTLAERTQDDLRSLEEVTLSLNALSALASTTDPQDVHHLAYLLHRLTSSLHDDFQAFHITVMQQLVPLVADVKVAHLVLKPGGGA